MERSIIESIEYRQRFAEVEIGTVTPDVFPRLVRTVIVTLTDGTVLSKQTEEQFSVQVLTDIAWEMALEHYEQADNTEGN